MNRFGIAKRVSATTKCDRAPCLSIAHPPKMQNMVEYLAEKRRGLLRECVPYWIYIALIVSIYASIAAVFYVFQTRETYLYYALGGTVLLSIAALSIYFMAIYRIIPRFRLRSLLKDSLYASVYKQDAVFNGPIGEETFRGVPCERLSFRLKGEGEDSVFLIEKGENAFVEGMSYFLYSHDHFILKGERCENPGA